ncbi:extracellular solute-binding protein [Lentzea sp. NPDC051208]|uniref:ABC transporter substrate-binding protein n=1 Tax=Lentzea sp. NPDC051208 TaxID=3154642 RepID=UPI003412C449
MKGARVDVVGPWTGEEQVRFEKVLAAFSERTGVQVGYTGSEVDLTTVVRTRVSGGTPPGVALLSQPGLVAGLAKSGAIKPVSDEVEKAVVEHYAPVWRTLGSAGGKLYGISFKVANKSTVWYSRRAFESASTPVGPPLSWDAFLRTARALANAGKPALSIAGADAWTLTDWFENVYLCTAGGEDYDKLARHEIPWTDRGARGAGGAGEALLRSAVDPRRGGGRVADRLRPVGDRRVRRAHAAAMVREGDFVGGMINSSTSAVVAATRISSRSR